MANLQLSWLDPVKQRALTIVGSKKMLVYDDIADDKVVIYDKGVEVPPYSITEEEFRASYRHGDETVYPFNWVEPLRNECNHFIECIQTGTTPSKRYGQRGCSGRIFRRKCLECSWAGEMRNNPGPGYRKDLQDACLYLG